MKRMRLYFSKLPGDQSEPAAPERCTEFSKVELRFHRLSESILTYEDLSIPLTPRSAWACVLGALAGVQFRSKLACEKDDHVWQYRRPGFSGGAKALGGAFRKLRKQLETSFPERTDKDLIALVRGCEVYACDSRSLPKGKPIPESIRANLPEQTLDRWKNSLHHRIAGDLRQLEREGKSLLFSPYSHLLESIGIQSSTKKSETLAKALAEMGPSAIQGIHQAVAACMQSYEGEHVTQESKLPRFLKCFRSLTCALVPLVHLVSETTTLQKDGQAPEIVSTKVHRTRLDLEVLMAVLTLTHLELRYERTGTAGGFLDTELVDHLPERGAGGNAMDLVTGLARKTLYDVRDESDLQDALQADDQEVMAELRAWIAAFHANPAAKPPVYSWSTQDKKIADECHQVVIEAQRVLGPFWAVEREGGRASQETIILAQQLTQIFTAGLKVDAQENA